MKIFSESASVCLISISSSSTGDAPVTPLLADGTSKSSPPPPMQSIGSILSAFDRPCSAKETRRKRHLRQREEAAVLPSSMGADDSGHRVFVYGSLLPGLHNHAVLTSSVCLGYFCTPPGFDMYSLGTFPAVCSGGQTPVTGALFRVDSDTLEHLDALESHPGWYRREWVHLPAADCSAWVYVMPRSMPEICSPSAISVNHGDWEQYINRTRKL